MVRVKICGITNERDAIKAVELGVDALGFIFAPSPRQVVAGSVRDIVAAIPPFVKTVGVFVNEEISEIRRLVEYCRLDLVQLHGDERPDACRALMPCVIKAFQVGEEPDLSLVRPFDAFSKERRGGTGRTFDWTFAAKAKELGIPVILSGGLGPSNIEEAVLRVRPYAVDVNSGVERSPGRKSERLMKTLMDTVRRIDAG
jgi:phosphoribosylanthranilate isomerase